MNAAVLLLLLAAAPLALSVDPCVEAPGLAKQVELELGPQGGEGVSARLFCEQGEVVIEVLGPGDGQQALKRVQTNGASGTTLTRLLALATAELVGAARAAPPSPAPPPELVEAPRVEKPVAEPAWVAGAQLEGLSYLGAVHPLGVGVRVGVERAVVWRVALRGELAFQGAFDREALGALNLLGGFVSLGPQVRLPVALPLSLGLAARFGVGRLAGTPADAATTDGFVRSGTWWGASANARLRFASADRAGFVVGLEGGVVLQPLVGLRSDGALWGANGGWVSLLLGWELPW